MMRLNPRLRTVAPSATLAVAAKARALRAQGRDVVDLSAGEPDFDTPVHIKEAAVAALERGMTKYTAVEGIPELRAAAAERVAGATGLSYQPEEVIITCGSKHALAQCLQVLIEPGDEVLIPTPCWVSYPDMVRLAGGTPRLLPTDESTGFRLTREELAAALATGRPRALVLNSPSNPTGAGYSAGELRDLAEILRETSVVVISDDCYDRIVYDGFRQTHILAVEPSLRDRVIVVNSVSKTYAMTGWRIGYAAGPREVISAMRVVQSQSTSNATSVAQAAALSALTGPQDCVERMVAEFSARRSLALDRLAAMPGLSCVAPQGAFYLFPRVTSVLSPAGAASRPGSPAALARHLIEEYCVALVPGEGFGSSDHIRLSFALDRQGLERGLERIGEAVRCLAR